MAYVKFKILKKGQKFRFKGRKNAYYYSGYKNSKGGFDYYGTGGIWFCYDPNKLVELLKFKS